MSPINCSKAIPLCFFEPFLFILVFTRMTEGRKQNSNRWTLVLCVLLIVEAGKVCGISLSSCLPLDLPLVRQLWALRSQARLYLCCRSWSVPGTLTAPSQWFGARCPETRAVKQGQALPQVPGAHLQLSRPLAAHAGHHQRRAGAGDQLRGRSGRVQPGAGCHRVPGAGPGARPAAVCGRSAGRASGAGRPL